MRKYIFEHIEIIVGFLFVLACILIDASNGFAGLGPIFAGN